jgi:hypothetical protein
LNRQRIAVLAVGALLLLAGPASAHQNGQVELFVKNLQFTPGQGGAMLHADMVDRDSGEKASGFTIRVTGVNNTGQALQPVAITEPGVSAEMGSQGGGHGHYEGVVPLGPGTWTLTVVAEQGASALPAVGSSRFVKLEVDLARGVAQLGGKKGGDDSSKVLWAGLAAALVAAGAGGAFVLARRRRPEPAAPAAQLT